jgi:hypothetical protein
MKHVANFNRPANVSMAQAMDELQKAFPKAEIVSCEVEGSVCCQAGI